MTELNNLARLGITSLGPDSLAIYFFVIRFMQSKYAETKTHEGKIFVKLNGEIIKKHGPDFSQEGGLAILSKLKNLVRVHLLERHDDYYSVGRNYDSVHGFEKFEVVDNRPKRQKLSQEDREKWLYSDMLKYKKKWITKCGSEEKQIELFKAFYRYWKQPVNSKSLNYEKQKREKGWDTDYRLGTFFQNSKEKFTAPNTGQGKTEA